jgi:hypothetical protein
MKHTKDPVLPPGRTSERGTSDAGGNAKGVPWELLRNSRGCETTQAGPPFREDSRARDERSRRVCEPANRVRHDLARFFRTSTTARPLRTGFAGSHTLLAHFVRPSSLKEGPKSMARSWRKGLVSSHPPGSSGTRSVPTRLSSLKGEPQSMARSSREGLAGLVVRDRLRRRGPGLCRDPLAGLDYGRGFIREQRRR